MTTTVQNLNFSSVSHDLRNYIGGISGMIDMIARDLTSYIEKQEASGLKPNEDLKEISNNAKMLSPYSKEALTYVDDLLNSSINEKEAFKTSEPEDCNIGELIKELLIFNESLILKHKVFATTHIQENLPSLKCDVFRLKQILINLITNAVKYSYSGGLVTIKAYGSRWIPDQVRNDDGVDNQICIEVSDCGIGMTEEELALALSGKGTQIDKSALNKNIPVDSHGIGLPNVIELVRLLNGKIEISSEKNRGTRITLLFNQTL